MFFGGISGSASADTAAIGSILIPAMAKSGYSKEFATAVTITSSPIGNLIPPSITLVIFGWLAGVQISRLFIAGIVPGILVGCMLMALSFFISKKHNFGTHQEFDLKELWLSFVDSLPALVLPIIILGGMFTGIFTQLRLRLLPWCIAFSSVFSFTENRHFRNFRPFLSNRASCRGEWFCLLQ